MNDGYYVGSISGTSVDGLDLALLKVSGLTLSIEHTQTAPLPEALRRRLLDLGQAQELTLEEAGACDALLGIFIGEAVNTFLAEHDVSPGAVNAIGSHGQTIRHRPDATPGQPAFTMQIGDPTRITEITGVTTVADFRRRDVAAGGQGAPLVPPFHRALFKNLGACPVIVNIGGISNVSVLDDTALGFDTGPGNGLMDAWCEQHRHEPFDRAGRWAASGEVMQPLLDRLLADPYFKRPPPKSTGREYFNLNWLEPMLETNVEPADVQATLCELTAQTILQGLRDSGTTASELIVVGGGRLNDTLMSRLTAAASCPVQASEALGVDGDSIEAAAFAWLAAQTLAGQPGNEPRVSGAAGLRILGAIYLA